MSGPTVLMSGSLKNTQPFKLCSNCNRLCEIAGGIQMSQNKWRCALCWRGFNASRK